MAKEVVVDNETYKERNVAGVWLGLPLITLGIYTLVWYYKINNEARRYLRDDSIKPGMSLLAFTLGAILIVPPFISLYNTGKRIQRMQQQAGLTSQIEPVFCILLTFLLRLETLYMQAALNEIWQRHRAAQATDRPEMPLIATPPPSSAALAPGDAAPSNPAASSATGTVAPADTDITSRLKQLADLHDAGTLTDAEFESAKASVLGRL